MLVSAARKAALNRDIRLCCAIIAWSIWLGGFTFYFGIVVSVGGAIVGGTEQGFVTQQVTTWLNLIGVASLLILLWNALAASSRILMATLVIMMLCHAALFALHYQLDGLVNMSSRDILDPVRFRSLHETYEGLSTVQWLTAMVHLFGIVRTANQACETPNQAQLIRSEDLPAPTTATEALR